MTSKSETAVTGPALAQPVGLEIQTRHLQLEWRPDVMDQRHGVSLRQADRPVVGRRVAAAAAEGRRELRQRKAGVDDPREAAHVSALGEGIGQVCEVARDAALGHRHRLTPRRSMT